MKKDVIAIFDIGKTNKKLLLFDESFSLLFQNEIVFDEIMDDDGFACEDIDRLLKWINDSILGVVFGNDFEIKAINFSTYGATLVFLDENGNRVAPVYNYLKQMPDGLLDNFYAQQGGIEEFSRKTASPALGMLNSGLQIYWLKNTKPQIWYRVKHILHLPQYISYIHTGKILSDYTSIGCHTALWDFDKMKYHRWLGNEQIDLPAPAANSTVFKKNVNGKWINIGIGIHDSSASLVPYLKAASGNKFILISTGTWAINMNPFSHEPLTADQLKKDCLCYLSIDKQQVKSSRLFLGHIHEINALKLSDHFKCSTDEFKKVKTDEALLKQIMLENKSTFFPNGIPDDYVADFEHIEMFESFGNAYHQLMFELAKFETEAIQLVLEKKDKIEDIYITGGFVKNDIFCSVVATLFKDKKVYSAEIYNATALGAAMAISPNVDMDKVKTNLERIKPIEFQVAI
jgi:sugar (pentulose or hexulose) kinase